MRGNQKKHTKENAAPPDGLFFLYAKNIFSIQNMNPIFCFQFLFRSKDYGGVPHSFVLFPRPYDTFVRDVPYEVFLPIITHMGKRILI